jgi:hypothetical protein
LISNPWRGRLRSHKGELQVVDDSVEHREIGEEGNNLYLPTRSASSLVSALTLLWTEKPEWRQPEIFSTRASEMRFSIYVP